MSVKPSIVDQFYDHGPLVASLLTLAVGAVVGTMFLTHHLFKESTPAKHAAEVGFYEQSSKELYQQHRTRVQHYVNR